MSTSHQIASLDLAILDVNLVLALRADDEQKAETWTSRSLSSAPRFASTLSLLRLAAGLARSKGRVECCLTSPLCRKKRTLPPPSLHQFRTSRMRTRRYTACAGVRTTRTALQQCQQHVCKEASLRVVALTASRPSFRRNERPWLVWLDAPRSPPSSRCCDDSDDCLTDTGALGRGL